MPKQANRKKFRGLQTKEDKTKMVSRSKFGLAKVGDTEEYIANKDRYRQLINEFRVSMRQKRNRQRTEDPKQKYIRKK